MGENKEKTAVEPVTEPFLMEDFEGLDMQPLLPTMNVGSDMLPQQPEKECIVKDDVLVGLYDEILEDCRADRKKTDEILDNFLDMVLNDGDANTSTKEAIVNLLKIRTDLSDKKSKVADLMTRHKLKEKDTFPKYLAAQQNNKVVIETSKRDLIKAVSKAAAKKGSSHAS